jgi:starch phosphorylase
MKSATRILCPLFNTNRMVHEYAERFYLPCYEKWSELASEEMARAKLLAQWKAVVKSAWQEVRVHDVRVTDRVSLQVGSSLEVAAKVSLGALQPNDVAVEVYSGPLDANGNIANGRAIRMKWSKAEGNGAHLFTGAVPCANSGRNGFAIRVVPNHEDYGHCHEPGLVAWK